MKTHIRELITHAITALQQQGQLDKMDVSRLAIQIERTRDPRHGNYACNIALVLAKQAKTNPRQLAEKLVAIMPSSSTIKHIEVAGPGFINFTLTDHALQSVITKILQQGGEYGHANIGAKQRIHIEYVSANPTGPLHVGHGRSAAFGACVANLLTTVGYDVHRDYYVNDAGRQMQILAISVWLRYQAGHAEQVELPANAYQGQYVIDIAEQLQQTYGDAFHVDQNKFTAQIPTDLDPKKEKETFLDTLIKIAINLLSEKNFELIKKTALNAILADIKNDLEEFGVSYDQWFHESQLVELGMLEAGVNLLKEHGYTYEKEGALWFQATSLGDEKDRVLIRKNGQPTYFASDVAYHLYKYNQGYDQVIDVFGADHHGYISRIRAFLQGLGKNPDKLKVLLVQFAILYRGKEKIAMSTRAGEFVTLRALRQEVGNDAARFFYIMRKPEQHLDFDLELAKSQSSDNPVYYIQYAHARICSVWRQLQRFQWTWDKSQGLENLSELTTLHEKNLLTSLSRYPEIICTAAKNCEPHMLAHYLQDLANCFHTYYNASRFLVKEATMRDARLCLIAATQQVLVNGMKILGLSAPEVM